MIYTGAYWAYIWAPLCMQGVCAHVPPIGAFGWSCGTLCQEEAMLVSLVI